MKHSSPITIESEEDLAREVAKVANDAKELGYKLEEENRVRQSVFMPLLGVRPQAIIPRIEFDCR